MATSVAYYMYLFIVFTFGKFRAAAEPSLQNILCDNALSQRMIDAFILE
jgi:hypothetical protein